MAFDCAELAPANERSVVSEAHSVDSEEVTVGRDFMTSEMRRAKLYDSVGLVIVGVSKELN